MKKLGTLLIIILFALGALIQFVFPVLVENTVKTRLSERLATHDVVVNFSSTPNALVTFGQADKFKALAPGAQIGTVYFEETSTEGEGLTVDILTLATKGQLVMGTPKDVRFKGVLTELNLKEIINRDDKFKDLEVKITPEEVMATAGLKLFGQQAEAELAGRVTVEDGALMFKLSRLNVKNSMIGTVKLDSLFSDVTLVKRGKLPFNAEFTDVNMADGKVFIEAGRKHE